MHGPLFCIPRIQLISVSVSRQQRRRGAMISQVTTQLFSGAVKTATHLAPPGDKLFSQCGCTNIFLPKSAAFCPSSFALWAQEAEGLYNLGLNGVTLMSESFTYLIEVSLLYSLFLCSQTFMAQMYQFSADFGIIEDNFMGIPSEIFLPTNKTDIRPKSVGGEKVVAILLLLSN